MPIAARPTAASARPLESSSVRPRIGMSLWLDAAGHCGAGRAYHYVPATYAAAIEAVGARVIYLPPQGEPGDLLDTVDALVIPGGDDFAPPRPYPEGVRFELVPEAQLAFDRALLDAALARDLPVLGICYGAQLLALACGGRLVYDIPTDRPGATNHRLGERDTHALEWVRDARLAGVFSSASPDGPPDRVNSRHHQAIDDPGALRIAARAPDGLIEAVEHPDHAFCIGVQWHPEDLPTPHHTPLFTALRTAAAAVAR